MDKALNRRGFLAQSLTGISAAWISAHWPAMLSAASHASQAANSASPPKFEFFSPEQAAEVDAISARIIPATDTPGAHEAGVVFFIDRALVTFAKDNQKTYSEGLPKLQAKVRAMFPDAGKFSAATPEQQDHVLQSFDKQSTGPGAGAFTPRSEESSFFEMIRTDTVMGFLIDPDSDRRGNLGGVGWKVIGRDPDHMFQPPFGYYDKDYPGWQSNPSDTDKK